MTEGEVGEEEWEEAREEDAISGLVTRGDCEKENDNSEDSGLDVLAVE